MPQEKTTAERVEQEKIAGRSFQSMNFVQSISEEDEQFERKNQDFVHFSPIHNNTFVTVTDARGNKKTGASAGCLEEIKGGSRLSRYAAEATAEHVGRSARKMGMKSVVMKVKGSTYFRKKKAVILSWREGSTMNFQRASCPEFLPRRNTSQALGVVPAGDYHITASSWPWFSVRDCPPASESRPTLRSYTRVSGPRFRINVSKKAFHRFRRRDSPSVDNSDCGLPY
ncbi:putative ribosomal protein S11 [Nymphaea thermarum]|nr:putative ribosomal protein S11 [Nymphaea thermarum]